MTTTEIVTRDQALTIVGNVAELVAAIQDTTDPTTLTEVRARVEAGKAWAKAHGLIQHHRVELLRVECHALRRIGQLGVEKQVLTTPSHQNYARYLAGVSVADIEQMITASASAMSAAGIVQGLKHAAALEDARDSGRDYAKNPPWPASPTPRTNGPEGVLVDDFREEAHYDQYDRVDEAYARRLATVSDALHAVVDEFTEVNQPFTVEEIFDAMVERTGLSSDIDQAVADGLREMIRKCINSALPRHTSGGFTAASSADRGGPPRPVRSHPHPVRHPVPFRQHDRDTPRPA